MGELSARVAMVFAHFLISYWDCESCSVVSDSLRPSGLYSLWNSPGQNTGVGSLSLLQGIFPTQGRTQVSRSAGGFLTSWDTREAHFHFHLDSKSV